MTLIMPFFTQTHKGIKFKAYAKFYLPSQNIKRTFMKETFRSVKMVSKVLAQREWSYISKYANPLSVFQIVNALLRQPTSSVSQ